MIPLIADVLKQFAAEITIAILTAFAVLGAGLWKNRSDIKSMKTAMFGHESGGSGQTHQLESIAEKLDNIESAISANEEKRRQEHHEMKNAVVENRRLMLHALDQLITEINYQSEEIDVEKSEILDGADDEVFRGGRDE